MLEDKGRGESLVCRGGVLAGIFTERGAPTPNNASDWQWNNIRPRQ